MEISMFDFNMTCHKSIRIKLFYMSEVPSNPVSIDAVLGSTKTSIETSVLSPPPRLTGTLIKCVQST